MWNVKYTIWNIKYKVSNKYYIVLCFFITLFFQIKECIKQEVCYFTTHRKETSIKNSIYKSILGTGLLISILTSNRDEIFGYFCIFPALCMRKWRNTLLLLLAPRLKT